MKSRFSIWASRRGTVYVPRGLCTVRYIGTRFWVRVRNGYGGAPQSWVVWNLHVFLILIHWSTINPSWSHGLGILGPSWPSFHERSTSDPWRLTAAQEIPRSTATPRNSVASPNASREICAHWPIPRRTQSANAAPNIFWASKGNRGLAKCRKPIGGLSYDYISRYW